MIRYKCTVAYRGAGYEGWQTQKNGRSIQEQLEQAIEIITQTRTVVTGSGRTDAGVNANGQVFHFDAEVDMPERKWMGALNRFLPDDIHIRSMERTDELFHARFCVKAKVYEYRINLGEYDVFSKDHAYQCPYKMNIEPMIEASKYLIGTHDFTSYNATSLQEIPDQVRTVYSIDFRREGDVLVIRYRGKGFLRYMVRMMSAVLMEIGKGRMEPIEAKRILDARSKTAGRKNAPPQGLTLAEVEYFQVLAMDDEVMIREFIDGEDKPEGESYLFVTRNTQQPEGVLRVKEETGMLKAVLSYYRPELAEKAQKTAENSVWKLQQIHGGKHVGIIVENQVGNP